MAGKIKGITIVFEGDSSKLQKSIRDIDKDLAKTRKELQAVDRALKFNPGNSDLIRQKQALLKNEVEQTTKKLAALKQQQKDMDAKGVDKNSAEYRKLQREIIETESKLKHFKAELKTLGGEKLQAIADKFKEIGKSMEQAGRTMTQKVTVPLAAVGGAALKTGMDFDSAMSQVAATMGTTTDQIQELEKFAREMGTQGKYNATEVAEGLNYMALAGYDAAKSMKMLPTVLNLAAAGNMELAQASDMVTDAQSALGLTEEETIKLIDEMAKASSKSNTSVSQLGEAMLTVGGTAKMMKGGTQELSTVLGLLADNGIKGSEGGTALRNILLSLSAPTDKAAKQLDALGVSVFDAEGNMRGMEEIINDLNTAMDGMTDEEKTQAISTIFNKRDLKSVNALLGTSTQRWNELSGAIGDAEGAAQAMADTQMDNLSGKLKILKNNLQEAGIAISEKLTPYVEKLANWIQGLVEKFNALDPETQDLIVKIGLIAAAIGPVLLIGGKIVSLIGVVLGAIAKLGAILNPITLIIAAVVAAGVLLYKNWDTIKEYAQKLWTQLKAIFQKIKDFIVGIWKGIKETASKVWTGIKDTISGAVEGVKSFLSGAWENIKENAKQNWENTKLVASTVWNGIKDTISGAVQRTRDTLGPLWDAIKTRAQTNWNNMKTGASTAFNAIKDFAVKRMQATRDQLTGIWNTIKTVTSTAWNKIKDLIVTPINRAKELISSAIQKIKDIFSGLKLQLPKVKLPHFKITGGEAPWGLGGKGSLPKFSVEWYKKAMNQPYMFSTPTLFGAGEAGDEMLYGRSALMRDIAKAVAGAGGGGGDTIINVYGSDNMSVRDLANEVKRVIIEDENRRRLAWQ